MKMTCWGIVKTRLTPFNESLIGFPFHIANKMELTEISKKRDRDYFHCIIKCIYVPRKLLKIQGYRTRIFQSSLQTELSPKITVHHSVNCDV